MCEKSECERETTGQKFRFISLDWWVIFCHLFLAIQNPPLVYKKTSYELLLMEKNVRNCYNTNISFYLETSGGEKVIYI